MNCKFILIYIFRCCCRLSRWCPLWRHETNESTSSHLKGERPTSFPISCPIISYWRSWNGFRNPISSNSTRQQFRWQIHRRLYEKLFLQFGCCNVLDRHLDGSRLPSEMPVSTGRPSLCCFSCLISAARTKERNEEMDKTTNKQTIITSIQHCTRNNIFTWQLFLFFLFTARSWKRLM